MEIPAGLSGTLVLVRHGESTWVAQDRFQGRGDPPLSPVGVQQAKLVAQRLADRESGAPLPVPHGQPIGIWHSPLTRADQTARLIAELQPGTTLHPTAGLIEISQGRWEGLTKTEVSTRWPAELAAWRRSPVNNHAPGGEALAAAAARVAGVGSELLSALAGVDGGEPWALVVAHDGIFRLLLITLLGLSLEHFWSFPFNLCAVSVVGIRDGSVALRAHNLAAAEFGADRGGAL
jgi:broad specificity phosphatase PhoE